MDLANYNGLFDSNIKGSNMDSLERKVNTPEYKNWIKGTLAIIHICEAVRVYTQHVFEQFKQGLSYGSHFDDGFNAYYMCRYTEWQESGRTWTFRAGCTPCTDLCNEIVRLHLTKDRRMGFENGRTKQIAGCWGIAKVFMPKCCEDVETPEDTDPYALFHMILNCGLFPLTHQHVESVIKARNDMMHSRTNTLSDGDTRTYINAMKDFLQDASSKVTGNNSSTVRDALDKARREIDELLLGEMNIDILSKEAKRALIFKKDYISKSVRVITSSGGNAQELREYLDILEKLGGELQFWNRHPWEIRKMSELNDIRNQLEIANQENEQLKEDLKKAQIDLKDVQQANIDIAQFQKELDEVQVKLNEVSMENQIKKTELSNIQDELNTSRNQKEKFQEQLEVVREHMTEVDKEHSTIKTELMSVDKNMNIAKEENKSMHDQLSVIQDHIIDVKGGNKKINNKIDKVNEELSIAKDQSEKFHEDLDDIRKKVENLEVHQSDEEKQTEDDMQNGKVITRNEKNGFEKTAPEQVSNIQERDNSDNISEELIAGKTDQLTTDHEVTMVGKEEAVDEQINEEQGNTHNDTEV